MPGRDVGDALTRVGPDRCRLSWAARRSQEKLAGAPHTAASQGAMWAQSRHGVAVSRVARQGVACRGRAAGHAPGRACGGAGFGDAAACGASGMGGRHKAWTRAWPWDADHHSGRHMRRQAPPAILPQAMHTVVRRAHDQIPQHHAPSCGCHSPTPLAHFPARILTIIHKVARVKKTAPLCTVACRRALTHGSEPFLLALTHCPLGITAIRSVHH